MSGEKDKKITPLERIYLKFVFIGYGLKTGRGFYLRPFPFYTINDIAKSLINILFYFNSLDYLHKTIALHLL